MTRKRPMKEPPLGPVVPMQEPTTVREPRFMLTPAQHRERARRFKLYAVLGHPKAALLAELAGSHEMLTTMIENRQRRQQERQPRRARAATAVRWTAAGSSLRPWRSAQSVEFTGSEPAAIGALLR